MAKRLSNAEVKALKNVIYTRIIEKKMLEKIEKGYANPEFEKWAKRHKELNEENDRILKECNELFNKMYDSLYGSNECGRNELLNFGLTYNRPYMVSDGKIINIKDTNLYVYVTDVSMKKHIEQELVMRNLNNDADVNQLIEEIVNKY